jgi:membrane protease subunit HflK
MFRDPGQGPQFNFDDILRQLGENINRLSSRFGGRGSGLGIVLIGILLLVWLATGVYQVSPSEQAALRLFGKYNQTVGSGLHWYYPAPLGARDIENVQEIRRTELGFRSRGNQPVAEVPFEALMITGDLNIVDIQLVVQYRISNLKDFLFEVDDPGEPARDIPAGRPEGTTLREATEAALRQVVGQRSIDDILTVAREEVQDETLILLQEILDEYRTGIQVREVRLQEVRPPDPVRDAFDDVVRARVDKQSLINQANAYKEDRIPRALGQAAQINQSAQAFRAERVARAEGEAQRFSAVLKEYSGSKEVTRQRLYLEAMEEILPNVTKFIIDADAGGGLLQLLNLDQQEGAIPISPLPGESAEEG